MPDVSPTKWHRAHTTWFFETFLLEPTLAGYDVFDPDVRVPLQLVLRGGRPPSSAIATRPALAAERRGGRALPRPRRRRDGQAHRRLRRATLAELAALVDARPAPRATAPRAAADGHQARALQQSRSTPAYVEAPLISLTTAHDRCAMLEHEGGLVEVGHDLGHDRVDGLRVRQRVARGIACTSSRSASPTGS